MSYIIFEELGALSMQLVRTLVARQITRRAFISFAADTAKYYALNSVLDETAKYSDWVKENKDFILLGTMGAEAAFSVGRKGAASLASKSFSPKLFCKMKVATATAKARAVFTRTRMRATANGFSIHFPNGEQIGVVMRDGKAFLNGKGSYVYPALLAAGFGGVGVALSQNDFEDTANQVAVLGSQFLHDLAISEITDDCRSRDSLTVLSSLRTIAAAYKAQFSYLTSDEIVSTIMLTLNDQEEHVGKFWVDSYVDLDNRAVFEINGVAFGYTSGDKELLEVVDPNERTNMPVSSADRVIEGLIVGALTQEVGRHHEMTHDEGTNRYYTTPVTAGERALSLVWDEENKSISFAISTDTMFESATEDLKGRLNASLLESAEQGVADAKDWVASLFGDQVQAAPKQATLVHTDSILSELDKGKL